MLVFLIFFRDVAKDGEPSASTYGCNCYLGNHLRRFHCVFRVPLFQRPLINECKPKVLHPLYEALLMDIQSDVSYYMTY